MFSKLLVAAVCALTSSVVNAAPGYVHGLQTAMSTQCTMTSGSNDAQTHLYPPVGTFLIGNVESFGGLLFESPSGQALVDFRRTGGHGDNILWEIRDAPGEKSTFWNVGTGHPLILEDKLMEGFTANANATEFTVKVAQSYPFYTIEAPISHKLWDVIYTEGRYPDWQQVSSAPVHCMSD
ncbi:hypothetical protein B0H11DRAFT_360730 [Mycena galericulata]|nr:hypothetical protein B0H11DRAFT_360730 [Mycena galericulata]